MHSFAMLFHTSALPITFSSDRATPQHVMDDHPRHLIPSLCALFYDLKWVTGTGGSISIKKGYRTVAEPTFVKTPPTSPFLTLLPLFLPLP